ncbi:MAG: ribonuclease D [Bauldia sp.]|nr:ribonuclease D [Bauldia sp.]
MRIISRTGELAEAVAGMANADVVTVDTEFMRETTYWPRLCVIQIASADDVVVIDAMAPELDLGPFFSLMANERVLKVFHSGRQDIEIVYHLAGLIPHPVFDTQIAAMVCGFGDSISYEQLVQRLAGESIDKSSRFTDWARRPLTERQLAYAAADVTHLRTVYRVLAQRLDEQGRGDWVEKEMEILTSESTYRLEPEEAWKRLRMRVRRPIELAVLKAIAAWREREAQTRDVPRSRVLKDDAIYEIAAQQPASSEALGALRTIAKGFERSRAGEEIVAVVQQALAIPRDTLPKIPKVRPPGEINPAAVDLLKVLLKMTSETHGVASKVIATVDDLEAIAADDDADVPALSGWRRKLFGDAALKLKRGDIALRLDGRRVRIVETGRRAAEAAE